MLSAAACPPVARTQCWSTNMIFWAGSSSREGTSSGRRCSCRAASAMRAERLEERTEANVAIASTSVPAPVAIAEIVAQSVASGTIFPTPTRRG